MRSRGLLAIAAGIEVVTGAALILVPSVVTRLLFDAGLAGAGAALAPPAGFALLALSLACWPTSVREGSGRVALRAMLLYNLLAALYLAGWAIRGGARGPLLWPGAALHAVLGVELARAWRGDRGGPRAQAGRTQ